MSNRGFAHNPVTLLHIAAYLRERSISPLEIFRRANLSPSMLLANEWVSRDLCFMLGEQLAAVSGERFPGSRIGHKYKLSDLGAWGRAVAAAPSIGQACAAAANGIGLLHQGTDLRLLTFNRHAQLRFSFRGGSDASPLQHLLGALVILRKVALLAGSPDAVSMRLSMPYARGVDALEEIYGAALEFGCEHDAIVIDRELIDQPVITNNGSTNSNDPADSAAAVGAMLKQLLPYGHVTIENLAARQRISVRTLQRRLRDWGFSFEEIVDDIRRTEAIREVLAGQHSIMEIAFLLGYSDHSHFTRAFKRWTGLPPQQYANTCRP
jgi:AraC-like DNA-binding protein